MGLLIYYLTSLHIDSVLHLLRMGLNLYETKHLFDCVHHIGVAPILGAGATDN